MASFVEMLENNNFVIYLNALDLWIVEQDYAALDTLYKSWNADKSIQDFVVQVASEKSYPELFVGKYFLYESPNKNSKDYDHKLASELPEVGSVYRRTNNLTHNWSKARDVAVDFSKVHYAGQPKTAYSNGFVAQCVANVPTTHVVCDCKKTINYITLQLKDPKVIELAKKNNIRLIKDILGGNDMMEDEHEVIVDGAFDKAKIIATWRRIDDSGKIFVDQKGQW